MPLRVIFEASLWGLLLRHFLGPRQVRFGGERKDAKAWSWRQQTIVAKKGGRKQERASLEPAITEAIVRTTLNS